MKKFLFFFALFFVIMFWFGYRRGANFVREPALIERYAFSRVTVENRQGKYFFVYPNAVGEPLYLFDPDTNHLIKASLMVASLTPPKGQMNQALFLNDPSVPGIIGGVSFGYTVKDILSNPKALKAVFQAGKRSKRKEIFGGLFGSISGYAAGYWTATYGALPAPEDPQVLDVIKDETKWRTRKFDIYANGWATLSFLNKQLDPKERAPNEVYLSAAAALALRRDKEGNQIRSADLRILSDLYEELLPEYEKLQSRQSLFERIMFWVGWSLFAFAIGAALTFYIKDMRSRKSK